MKFKILEYLVIAVLSYYLIKGLIFIFMWQTLVQMEVKGKRRVAKEKEEKRQKRERRDQRARDNWESKS